MKCKRTYFDNTDQIPVQEDAAEEEDIITKEFSWEVTQSLLSLPSINNQHLGT